MSIRCIKCGYLITEPMCASCVIREIKIWFKGQPLKKESLRKISHELSQFNNKIESLEFAHIPSQDFWESQIKTCILCKENMHLMCSYCVINKTSQIVRTRVKDKASIENFKESFNTEWHQDELNKINHSF